MLNKECNCILGLRDNPFDYDSYLIIDKKLYLRHKDSKRNKIFVKLDIKFNVCPLCGSEITRTIQVKGCVKNNE